MIRDEVYRLLRHSREHNNPERADNSAQQYPAD